MEKGMFYVRLQSKLALLYHKDALLEANILMVSVRILMIGLC